MLWRSKTALRAAACVVVFTAAVAPASAQDGPDGVIELFTSQGCSSCPPADAVLAELADSGDWLALSYHVDYWNYLGWKDTLASAENTQRQHAYARMLERKSVYTPQAILNGRQHINGADRAGIESELAEMQAQHKGMVVDVDLTRDGDTLSIEIGEGKGKANVLLAVFDRLNKVAVEDGENSGRTITYVNSVQSMQVVGMWKGEPVSIELPASVVEDWSRQDCAVLLQTMRAKKVPGAIIGAAALEPVAQ